MIFEVNWSIDFGHTETGSRAISEWFCGVIFFCSNFKVEWENGVWAKIRFLANGFLFACGILTLIFDFLFLSDFFKKQFSQFAHSPFYVYFLVKSLKILWIVRQDLSCYVFYFVVKFFVTIMWRHSHFRSAFSSCNFKWISYVTSVFTLFGASFLFIRVIKFLVSLDIPLKNDFLTLKLTFLYFREIRSTECILL